MEFPDDSNDSLMLSAVESYETQANKVDESVRFETEEIHADDDQPDDIYLVALKARFGHNNFRPLQWKIIKSILVNISKDPPLYNLLSPLSLSPYHR